MRLIERYPILKMMLNVKLSQKQTDILSKYFADVSKLLVASVVIGFFIPSNSGSISIATFASGFLVTVVCLILSLRLVHR